MSLQKYRIVLKILETGSITAAAEALNYSQSSVSQALSSLEAEWGLSLLHRDRTGVAPTANLDYLLPVMQEICRSNQVLKDMVGELQGLRTGRLRFGCLTSLSVNWLPAVLKSFRKTYPQIDFEIQHGDYSEIEALLLDGSIDFGFLRLPISEKLEYRYLGRDWIVALLPPLHPMAAKTHVSIRELAGEPLIVQSEGSWNEIEDLFHAHGIQPNICFRVSDDHTIISFVENGLGVSLLPKLVLWNSQSTIAIRELDAPVYRDLCIAMHSSTCLTPPAQRFLAHLQRGDIPDLDQMLC